jgi:hypothetical protein
MATDLVRSNYIASLSRRNSPLSYAQSRNLISQILADIFLAGGSGGGGGGGGGGGTPVADIRSAIETAGNLANLIGDVSDLLLTLQLVSGNVDGLETLLGNLLTAVNLTNTRLQTLITLSTDISNEVLDLRTRLQTMDGRIANLQNVLGAPDDPPAMSNTGNFSISSFLKRNLALTFHPRIVLSTNVAVAAPVTLIPAPPEGQRIIITSIVASNTTATQTTLLFRNGTDTIYGIRVPANGNVTAFLTQGSYFYLTPATEFTVLSNVASPVIINMTYYIENVTTGLPV